MRGKKPNRESLVKRIQKLENELKSEKEAFENTRQWIDQKTRDFESYKSTADMLELCM